MINITVNNIIPALVPLSDELSSACALKDPESEEEELSELSDDSLELFESFEEESVVELSDEALSVISPLKVWGRSSLLEEEALSSMLFRSECKVFKSSREEEASSLNQVSRLWIECWASEADRTNDKRKKMEEEMRMVVEKVEKWKQKPLASDILWDST